VSGVLVRGAEVAGRTIDVRVAGDRIADVGVGLQPAPGDEVLHGDGGALLPGLHDAHLHLLALAAVERSVRCGPPDVRDRAGLVAALAAGTPDPAGWIRGVGYVETVAGDLDREALDELHRDRPVRVQHRSGALWVVNTAGAKRLGLDRSDHPGVERASDGTPTGRLWRADDWLRSRLPPGPPPLAPLGRRLAALGITAVCDATPDLDDAALTALTTAAAGGALPQRLEVLGAPLGSDLPVGTRSGPYKIVIADSALPSLDELVERVHSAHEVGRAVALHSVTREALVLLLAAFDTIGARPGDRVEHAALVPAELIPELARHGLRVVTQPGFLAHRGDDYLRDVPVDEHADLYRCRSLVDGGVRLALSSDAPYGPLDPWVVIAAAAERRTPAGDVVGPAERLPAARALDAYLSAPGDPGGPPRRVRIGAEADLLLLDRPLAAQLAAPAADAVRAVLIGGRVVHG
jgi:predicted amidohydrolase YtcJ